MMGILEYLGLLGLSAGFIAATVELSVRRNIHEINSQMEDRDREIDKRLDVVEMGITQLHATVTSELKYLEKAVDELNECKIELGDRQR